jgi:hypothetical protein
MGYRVNNIVKTGGIPMHIAGYFLDNIRIYAFVETGTAAGDSVKEAARHIGLCHTIELIPERQLIDQSISNIFWHRGNSIDVLPGIIESLLAEKSRCGLKEGQYYYTLFWLDAHYSGNTPNTTGYKECYLLEELDIISAMSQHSIILIDDARLFMGKPPQPNNAGDWPSVQQIFRKIEEKYPYFIVTIIDDYILAIPDRIGWVFDLIWQEGYFTRYPSEPEKLRMEVKNVFEAFKNYIR